MPTPPINTLQEFIYASSCYEAKAGKKPLAVVLSSHSPFAAQRSRTLYGHAVAYDPQLDPAQALFFTDLAEFNRYTSRIP